MRYFANGPDDIQHMLDTIGIASVDELFDVVPEGLRLDGPLDLPAGKGELELLRHMRGLAARNLDPASIPSFLGFGCRRHFIPAVVDDVAGRSEYVTAYTPYQPEASQGHLQAIFEFQTAICELTAMGIANASMYDGATSLTEAVLMAAANGKGSRVVVSAGVHPEYREVLATYLGFRELEIITVPLVEGRTPADWEIPDGTVAAVFAQPNCLGLLEDAPALADRAHSAGALVIPVVDPLSLGILAPPGEYGADLACAEGQGLGNSPSFGGPHLGILCAGKAFMRRMPGRMVGRTTDVEGRPGYVLTLQTREQHIRREKATSNICTNQALLALRATIYLAALGPAGLREVGTACAQRARHLATALEAAGYRRLFPGPYWNELLIECREPAAGVIEAGLAEGLLVGIDVSRIMEGLPETALHIAVTELNGRDELDRLVAFLSKRA